MTASEMRAGDRVVYPKQGVCQVLGLESKEIAGQRLEFVSMTREEDNATILVPVAKVPSIGLRRVADSTEIVDVFDLLASSFDDPELDWKVRHRLHGDLLSAGGILGVAEVLKALQGLANIRPLPPKERERYDAARHLLVAEVAVSLGVPLSTAEDFIDLALLPPPGTVRPAAKPRRLAELPPRPRLPARTRGRRGEGEELEELELEEELEFEEEPIEAEAGEEPEAEAEEPAEEEVEEAGPSRKAAARAPKKAAAEAGKKAPARAKKAAPAKKAEETEAPEKPAAKKPAAKKAAPAEKPAPAKKAAGASKAAKAEAPAARTAPMAEAAAKKPAARKTQK
ncbi:CarD family transcriptional regulator [Vulgatibacter incomptus]|uniref:Transcriptional regulator, CarD family n=1 Tax=Vulgatibacter incomptus TaxID=1391653 RepID=A0A0K1PEB8_9BACT|nr:CarD family transcriptional regulator [Vulgatibacter incomptus]AKU91883.1 transcriptional regulator, CarD family [Vulgatibacter incomptus]